MGNILLGLAACFGAWGSFLLVSSLTNRNLPFTPKVGRAIRGMITETVGLVFFILSLWTGGKVMIVLPVFLLTLGLSAMAGLIHGVLRSRTMTPATAPAPETPEP